MLTKGKSQNSWRATEKSVAGDPESVALRVLGCLVSDSERLERFLSLTGLRPDTIRAEASKPEFLLAVLDYVAADEALLVAIAGELELPPEAVAAAQHRLGGIGPEP
jgi:hypothetical protein